MNSMKKIWRPWLCTAVVCMMATGMAMAQPAPAVAPAAPQAATTPSAPQAPAAPATPAPRAMTSGGTVYMFGQGSYLGVDLRDVTSDRVGPLKLSEERGAEVTMVDSDSPAGKSGVKEHDVIMTFNGTKVDSVEQLRRMIHELPAGRTVTLGLSREGKPVTVTATLADRKALTTRYRMATTPRAGTHIMIPPIPPIDFDMPNIDVIRINTTRTGVTVSSLTPQLGEYFGAPNGRGLLVSSVEKGSVAEAAGLKAGDVIVKVANDRITDTGDWRMALREHTGSVTLTIIRDKREQTVTIKLPERKETGQFQFEFPDMGDIAFNFEGAGRAMEQARREIDRAMRESGREFEREMRVNKEKIKVQNEKLKQQLKQEMKKLEEENDQ